MTDIAASEVPAEVVPPAPDIAVEIETVAAEPAPTEATAPLPPASAEAPTPAAERSLPFDVDHLGVLRRSVLDHLLDTAEAGPQSVSQILAAMPPGTSRNTLESALRRSHDGGHVEKIGPGLYVLGKPKRAEPPKPAPPDEAVLFEVLERWAADPASWPSELGPPPNDPASQISLDIRTRFLDRVRKREARRKDAEAAAARQVQADRELRARLVEATGGNIQNGPDLDDLASIKAAMEFADLDLIVLGIGRIANPKLVSPAVTVKSWRQRDLLESVAKVYCRSLQRRLVKTWATAKAPGKAVERVEPSDQESAPAASPAQPDRIPDDDAGIYPAADALPALDDETSESAVPVAAGREQILAAFNRNRTPPPPAPRQPQAQRPAPQPPPSSRPWFADSEPTKPEFNDEAWDEFCTGFRFGTLKWNTRRLGPEPGDPNCKVPAHVLRRNGL